MGKLVDGDDGARVEKVGAWVEDKHRVLREYLKYQAHPRLGYVDTPRKAGATYIDLFCGPGRSWVKDTTTYVDGSAVMAWKASVAQGAPFSEIFISDLDAERLDLCTQRLRALNAPARPIHAPATEAAKIVRSRLNPYGLHFAFLDPFNLGSLELEILKDLSSLSKRPGKSSVRVRHLA